MSKNRANQVAFPIGFQWQESSATIMSRLKRCASGQWGARQVETSAVAQKGFAGATPERRPQVVAEHRHGPTLIGGGQLRSSRRFSHDYSATPTQLQLPCYYRGRSMQWD